MLFAFLPKSTARKKAYYIRKKNVFFINLAVGKGERSINDIIHVLSINELNILIKDNFF
jgi:hypothetical protein